MMDADGFVRLQRSDNVGFKIGLIQLDRRKLEKLVLCYVVKRAIHLELCTDVSAVSILGISRFSSLRRLLKLIFYDNFKSFKSIV